jgi:hypothetical protein
MCLRLEFALGVLIAIYFSIYACFFGVNISTIFAWPRRRDDRYGAVRPFTPRRRRVLLKIDSETLKRRKPWKSMVLMMKCKTHIRHHFAGQHTFRGRPLLDRYSTVTRPLLDRYSTVTRPLRDRYTPFSCRTRYLPGTWARLCHIASRYLPVALRYKTSIFAYILRDMYAEGKLESDL